MGKSGSPDPSRRDLSENDARLFEWKRDRETYNLDV
jgi:hypothetical protein